MRSALPVLLSCALLAACGQSAVDNTSDSGSPADAAAGSDASNATDSGAARDSAAATDSSAPRDAGTPVDSSTPRDSGTPADSSTPMDSGVPADSGAPDVTPLPLSRCPADIAPDPRVNQALPNITDFDTAYPTQSGRTVQVAAGDDLQAAIDAAQPGDTLELAADATFTGPFHLRAKTGAGWIVIRTATPDSMLPPEGTRITPSAANLLPNILVHRGIGSVFDTDNGASHYRLVGLEILPAAGDYVNALVSFGGGETSVDQMPHHMIVDRSYVHADPTAGGRRGVALNGGSAAVIDSWVSGFFEMGADSQAVGGFAGTGPFRIFNNYLEGASENVLFGGADPSIANVVQSDIEVCGNHFFKPREWMGTGRVIKNLFELKNARRVLVAGNILENCWTDGQSGFAVVLTPRNQNGTAPWSTVEDVTFTRNIVRAVGAGVSVLGEDNDHMTQQAQRIVVTDNLIDVDSDAQPGAGRAFQITTPNRPTVGLAISHNTVRVVGNSAMTVGDTTVVATMFFLTDNVMQHGNYGFFGGGVGEGNAALMHYLPDAVIQGNVLIGFQASRYPAQNNFPADDNAVGFADPSMGDWSLSSSSPYASSATDGTSPGADFPGIRAATAGVVVAP